MSCKKSFPLAIISTQTGQVLKEVTDFTGYLPDKKEYFTVDKSTDYRCDSRHFFYDADMNVTAVELWGSEV